MKRFSVILAGILLVAGLCSAQDYEGEGGAGSWVGYGSNLISVGIGSGFYSGVDVTIGYEIVPFAFPLNNTEPFALGFALNVNAWAKDMWISQSAWHSTLDLSIVFHISWRSIFPEIEWLSGFHNYVGAGGALNFERAPVSFFSLFKVGFVAYGGLSYFFTRNVSLFVEGGWYTYRGAGKLGVAFQF